MTQKRKEKSHKANHFFDIFPTPRFLEMTSPGVAIEDGSLRYVEFGRTKKGLELKSFDFVSIPDGVIVGGDIKNVDALSAILSEFRKKHDIYSVRCSLPEEKGYLFRSSIPKASTVETRTAVEFIIEENVPLSVQEVVFDYSLVRVEKEEDESVDVAVSVVPELVVRSYMEVFQKAGMLPLHFEMESQALIKSSISREDLSPYLLVHLLKRKIIIAVISNGVIHFSSVVHIKNTTTKDDGRKQKTSELEKGTIKKVHTKNDVDITNLPLDDVEVEVKKLISYWNSSFEKKNQRVEEITSMIVNGHSSDNEELIERLGKIGIDISVANVWINAFDFKSFVPQISKSESLEYAVAIGLSLPHHFHF